MNSIGKNNNGGTAEENGTRDAKLKALMRREAAVKAALDALRELKKKQRNLDHETALKIHGLIGAAVAADLKTAAEETPQHRAYITEILDHYYVKGSGARTLLEANGWL